jgi:RNA polymerase sigma factor (TIGR02999 family)
MSDVTRILNSYSPEDPKAAAELLPLVYKELRCLAEARMRNEAPGQTLQATALVHEAWIRLLGPDGNEQCWGNRAHFFAASAEAIRRILIDRARKKKREKHGGKLKRIDFEELDVAETAPPEILLVIDDAIEKLAEEDPDAVKLIKLRFFIGLEMSEIANTMEISERAAYRLWAFARAWLFKELQQGTVGEPSH